MVAHPDVLWAQRSDTHTTKDPTRNIVYLTVDLPHIKRDTLETNLTEDNLAFHAFAQIADQESREYAFTLDFYEKIIPEESSRRLNGRRLEFVLRKKTQDTCYWPRLQKEKGRLPFIKIDFDKWVDENEQETNDDDADFDFDNMNHDVTLEVIGRETGLDGISS